MKIQVIDGGQGIEESDRDKLFKMFGMHDNNQISTKGIGLGLSISNLIVKKFNGAIDFTSEVGVGSNFFFTFELNELPDDNSQIEEDSSSECDMLEKLFKINVDNNH